MLDPELLVFRFHTGMDGKRERAPADGITRALMGRWPAATPLRAVRRQCPWWGIRPGRS